MPMPKLFPGRTSKPPSPPFDASSFDPSTLSKDELKLMVLDPDLCLIGTKPALEDAASKHGWVRRKYTVEVSPSVLALGKNPYPGLRQSRSIPELNRDTPAYDPCQPWFGDNPLLRYLTPSKLLQLGCINTGTGIFSPISPQFRIDQEVAARVSRLRTAPGLYMGKHDGIHPIVRRSQFRLTSDYEYECLKPTLRIVTKMLEMDSVLDMLWSLGQRWTQVRGTKKIKDVYVYYTGRSTPQQRRETALELEKLVDFVHFEWGDTKNLDSVCAKTYPMDEPGLRGGITTRACRVGLDDEFRYIIAGGSALRADLYNPEAQNMSSFLRTQLWLATIIIHELGHVFRLNTNKLLEANNPFCNDSRIAEEGNALEAAVHKGVIMEPNSANPRVLTTPFGMVSWKWPGIHDGEYYDEKSRWTVEEEAPLYHTFYAMKMEYIRDFFNDEFWNQRYLRFGGQAFSGFAAVGVRLLFEDDSSASKIKRNMAIGLELEADEWMPGVIDQGIVYRDRVLNLSGGTEIARDAEKVKTAEEKMIDEIVEGFVVKDMKKLKIAMREKIGSPARSPGKSPGKSPGRISIKKRKSKKP
ncbi:hypothetical protein KCU81_g167, partial [Aureobasidium melanogenum]